MENKATFKQFSHSELVSKK